MTRPGLCTVFPLLVLMFPLSSVSWEVNALICVSQSLKKGETFLTWICHRKFRSLHDVGDPLVLSVTSFSLVPNATAITPGSLWVLPVRVGCDDQLLHTLFQPFPGVTILA